MGDVVYPTWPAHPEAQSPGPDPPEPEDHAVDALGYQGLREDADPPPAFVLRGSDPVAPLVLRMYGVLLSDIGGAQFLDRVNEAFDAAKRMREWLRRQNETDYPREPPDGEAM